MSRIFQVAVSDWLKVAVYVPHPKVDPATEIDVDKTYGYQRTGMSGCRYYRWAYQNAGGVWEKECPVVAVLPGEDKPADPDQFPRLPAKLWQQVMDNPKGLMESLLVHKLVFRHHLSELYLPKRAIRFGRRFADDYKVVSATSWVAVEAVPFSYTANVIVRRDGEEIVLGSVPKWVMAAYAQKRGRDECGWVAPRPTPGWYPDYVLLYWRHDVGQDKEVWYVYNRRRDWYVGWERVGRHARQLRRLRVQAFDPRRHDAWRLGDVVFVPPDADSEDWHRFPVPDAEQLEQLQLVGAEWSGDDIVTDGMPGCVYHPEHGSITLQAGQKYAVRTLNYVPLEHSD